ncbi:hypothetical protein J4448_06555 [Candidatus Woesearchaeota archaeon]|nr:hypothetical protein [Candidatus Woesearchaeota archaeon]
MKNLIFILMLFLTLQIVYAETKIFSGTVITDTDKVIEGSIFKFKYDDVSNKVFAQTPTTALIVDNGACKSNNVFRVCINRANFSYKNVTTYVYYYEVDATIYKLTGSLSTSSKSILTDLLQGESTEFTITITNPTDFDITDIIYNEDLTPFLIKDVKGCSLDGNQIKWQGFLTSKYDKTCTATIAAEKEGTQNLAGNLSYFNGFETEKKTTDSITIKVLPKQLKISQFTDKNIEIKKPFYFNISLQNVHSSEDINSFAAIMIPSHVSLIKDTPVFEKNARVLKHSLMLKPGAAINYSLYMEKLSEGKEPINYRFDYTIKGISDVIENSTFVDIISVPTNKPSEPEIEKEEYNATANLTATNEVQGAKAIDENKTTAAEIEPANKTIEKVTSADLQEPKLFSKNILLLSIVVLATFIIILLVIFKIRKRKKESDELAERIKEKLKEPIDEQIK